MQPSWIPLWNVSTPGRKENFIYAKEDGTNPADKIIEEEVYGRVLDFIILYSERQ